MERRTGLGSGSEHQQHAEYSTECARSGALGFDNATIVKPRIGATVTPRINRKHLSGSHSSLVRQ